MPYSNCSRLILAALCGVFSLSLSARATEPASARATEPASPYWNVDELKIGQRGYGLTVMKGIKRERFEAEVLGVLKNTSPGRDMVLCRLSGLDLERTGVIAGMSGSPVYIDNRLLGAVAFAWAYGKDPIAGVTPFTQMKSYAESFERRQMILANSPVRVGLAQPIRAGNKSFEAVSVSQDFGSPKSGAEDELCMTPLRTPLSASGFSANSLRLLREQYADLGLTPMQGGAIAGTVAAEAKDAAIVPGAALTVALIDGDFDMSGIGTVTQVEGKRVYGWGHPFMSLGGCEMPLMTGWVHTIYPRQSVSFKMGSPLKTVGVINNDVSTGIAGWLDREPDMLPVTMRVRQEPGGDANTFKVRIARQKQLLPALVYAALTNSVDMEGDLPEDMTVAFACRIEIEGKEPVIIKDTFAGSSYSGTRAPASLYSPVSQIMTQILNYPDKPLRITKIDCDTEIRAGRESADIEGVELASDTYAPGETLHANAFLRPYRGKVVRVPLTLKIPADLPEGSYTLTVCDELTSARQELRNRPQLTQLPDEDRLLEALRLLTAARRSILVARFSLPASGVALDGKALANLPPSMMQILSQSRRSPVLPVSQAVIGTAPTQWAIYGSETARFNVTQAKHTGVAHGE
jgi:hypothetical protein